MHCKAQVVFMGTYWWCSLMTSNIRWGPWDIDQNNISHTSAIGLTFRGSREKLCLGPPPSLGTVAHWSFEGKHWRVYVTREELHGRKTYVQDSVRKDWMCWLCRGLRPFPSWVVRSEGVVINHCSPFVHVVFHQLFCGFSCFVHIIYCSPLQWLGISNM